MRVSTAVRSEAEGWCGVSGLMAQGSMTGRTVTREPARNSGIRAVRSAPQRSTTAAPDATGLEPATPPAPSFGSTSPRAGSVAFTCTTTVATGMAIRLIKRGKGLRHTPGNRLEHTYDSIQPHSHIEDVFDNSSMTSSQGWTTVAVVSTRPAQPTSGRTKPVDFGDDPLTPGGSPFPGLFRSVVCPVCCAGRRRRRRRHSSRGRSRNPRRC